MIQILGDGSIHTKKLAATQITKPVNTFMYKKDFNTEKIGPLAEIKFAEFFAKHNLHLAAADFFSHLICIPFPNSKIV